MYTTANGATVLNFIGRGINTGGFIESVIESDGVAKVSVCYSRPPSAVVKAFFIEGMIVMSIGIGICFRKVSLGLFVCMCGFFMVLHASYMRHLERKS